jgi:hypothetical protein
MSRVPNGRKIRDIHRQALLLHFCVMVGALMLLALLNRRFTPQTLWVHWALLGWSALFLAHLLRFEKGTMRTMGRKR